MNKVETLRAEFLVLHGLTEAEIDRRINHLVNQRQIDLDNIREQVSQAKDALEHRLDIMNAFREENRDQAAKSVTREVMDQMVLGLRSQDQQQEERIRALEAKVTNEAGAESAVLNRKRSQQAITGLAISFVIGAVALVSLVIALYNSTRIHG